MKDEYLERLIEAEKCRCLPRCPGNLEESVLRQVRVELSELETPGILQWLLGVPKSGLVLGSLALAILLSTVTSLAVVSVQERGPAPGDLARSALDFQIFNEVHVVNLDHGD
jgi:hypothetical protein